MNRGTLPILLLAGLLLLSGCGSGTPVTSANNPLEPARPAPPGMAVLPADSPQLREIESESVIMAPVPIGELTVPGKVEVNTNHLSHVLLPVAGRVTDMNVRLGDFVSRGQKLLSVESPDADAAISAFLQAQAAVVQAKSTAAKAQQDFDREKDLYEHGAVPQKDLLNAESVLVQARAGVDSAAAAEQQARRRLEILGIKPGTFGQRVAVCAPISGKVLEIAVVEGEYRNDSTQAVLTIADLSTVWVTSEVPETAIRLVRTGQPVRIELNAFPGETFSGRVTQIADTVDAETRTVKVRAEMTNKDGRLRPEMFGSIHLSEQVESRPTVPSSALVNMAGQTIVWRQVEPATFSRTVVTTGASVGSRVSVLSGLSSGDSVVTRGVMLLRAN